jgi:hypothetical protein
VVVVGLIVGVEGLVALWLPLIVGSWSDRLRSRLEGRLPFLVAGTPIVMIGLVALSLVCSVALAAAALVFFVGYFLAYESYRALCPDAAAGEIAAGLSGGVGRCAVAVLLSLWPLRRLGAHAGED